MVVFIISFFYYSVSLLETIFLAIIIPQARDDIRCMKVIIIAAVFACCFRYIPFLKGISSGFVIIICAVLASVIGAVLYPVEEE